jgi:hypothetical protein
MVAAHLNAWGHMRDIPAARRPQPGRPSERRPLHGWPYVCPFWQACTLGAPTPGMRRACSERAHMSGQYGRGSALLRGQGGAAPRREGRPGPPVGRCGRHSVGPYLAAARCGHVRGAQHLHGMRPSGCEPPVHTGAARAHCSTSWRGMLTSANADQGEPCSPAAVPYTLAYPSTLTPAVRASSSAPRAGEAC